MKRLAVGALALSACAWSGRVDRLVYQFHDKAVPPPFHRSFTITATSTNIVRVVDSYGREIERSEKPLSKAQFDRLLSVYRRAGYGTKVEPVNTACTGGTGETIEAFRGGVRLFEASVYHCQGDSGALVGDPHLLRDAMSAYFSSGSTARTAN
jgi:hypothetical protein